MSRDTGVCLTVPEGAVRHGCNAEIFLAVLRHDRDRPKLSGLYSSLRSIFLSTFIIIIIKIIIVIIIIII